MDLRLNTSARVNLLTGIPNSYTADNNSNGSFSNSINPETVKNTFSGTALVGSLSIGIHDDFYKPRNWSIGYGAEINCGAGGGYSNTSYLVDTRADIEFQYRHDRNWSLGSRIGGVIQYVTGDDRGNDFELTRKGVFGTLSFMMNLDVNHGLKTEVGADLLWNEHGNLNPGIFTSTGYEYRGF